MFGSWISKSNEWETATDTKPKVKFWWHKFQNISNDASTLSPLGFSFILYDITHEWEKENKNVI